MENNQGILLSHAGDCIEIRGRAGTSIISTNMVTIAVNVRRTRASW
jgi:hypothetical protein